MTVAKLVVNGHGVWGVVAGGRLKAAVNVLPCEHLDSILAEFRSLASGVLTTTLIFANFNTQSVLR